MLVSDYTEGKLRGRSGSQGCDMRLTAFAFALMASLAGCGSQQGRGGTIAEPIIGFQQASASVATHGERLTRVLGCRGCHGKELQGERFYELYASNLTRDLANYSDAELSRLLRQGVHPTGRDVWGMPSELFQHLSGPDEDALITYLRTLKPAGGPTQPRLPWTPDAEKMIAEGKIKPAAATVKETMAVAPVDLGPQYALGRYITQVTCAECHGSKLQGGDGTPDLIVVASYSPEEFDKLITNGIPTGNRKLHELMVSVAKGRFAFLTTDERRKLYTYLKARADQPQ